MPFITLHGFPPAITSEGMSDTTTLPTATIDRAPILTPLFIIHFAPINTSSSISFMLYCFLRIFIVYTFSFSQTPVQRMRITIHNDSHFYIYQIYVINIRRTHLQMHTNKKGVYLWFY